MIVILFTGGTIAMRNDPGGEGAKPNLTPAEILQATKGIRAITGIETEEWGQFPGPHMTVERMWALRNRIAEHLARRLKEIGYGTRPVDGLAQGDWALVDAGDVIVHVFRPEVRDYYDLEGMWSVEEPDRAIAR